MIIGIKYLKKNIIHTGNENVILGAILFLVFPLHRLSLYDLLPFGPFDHIIFYLFFSVNIKYNNYFILFFKYNYIL